MMLAACISNIWKLVDLVLPPRCLVTGDIVDRQGTVSPVVWKSLNFIADPQCACCGYPFEYKVESGVLCAACLAEAPPFSSARAALAYDDPSRDMVLKFKHGDQTHAVHTFVPWLRRAGADMLAQADMLIPVPLHPLRLLRRRYNQAALLSQALGKACGLPCYPGLLRRRRATPSQGRLGPAEREKNVRGAFVPAPGYTDRIKGKTVILVDDVYTTGATVAECARVLRKNGAKAVHVLTVARVIRPGNS